MKARSILRLAQLLLLVGFLGVGMANVSLVGFGQYEILPSIGLQDAINKGFVEVYVDSTGENLRATLAGTGTSDQKYNVIAQEGDIVIPSTNPTLLIFMGALML